MRDFVLHNPLALPRGWPRSVRSAVVQAISLAGTSMAATRGWASDSLNASLRRRAEVDRLQQEIQLLREEIRIKDSRMQLTIASWTARLDEEGADALVRLPEPVNRFPEFVGYVVRRLKFLCPAMGRVKIAQVLARAGLHLAPTTVRRVLREDRRPRPSATAHPVVRAITARKPNDLWHLDLTTVPTSLGFWIPGCRSLSLRCGPSAGGSLSSSTTARGASWASQSSAGSPQRRPCADSWSVASARKATSPGIW